MPRAPSPELVRFFLKHEGHLANLRLGQVREAIANWAEQWDGFDRQGIFADLAFANEKIGPEQFVRDVAQPVVFCLFSDGQEGKSTTANMLKRLGVPVFSTDHFVSQLRENWHGNDALRQLATEFVPHQIDNFIRQMERMERLQSEFVSLLFDATNGFNSREPLSVIEGFVHARDVRPHNHCLRDSILRGLLERGYRVWQMRRHR